MPLRSGSETYFFFPLSFTSVWCRVLQNSKACTMFYFCLPSRVLHGFWVGAWYFIRQWLSQNNHKKKSLQSLGWRICEELFKCDLWFLLGGNNSALRCDEGVSFFTQIAQYVPTRKKNRLPYLYYHSQLLALFDKTIAKAVMYDTHKFRNL